MELPDVLESVIADNKDLNPEVWHWFGEFMRQYPEKGFKRFARLTKGTLCFANPSFVGLGNSFWGKVILMQKLMQQNIKIRIAITYYPDFYWYLVKWVNEFGPYAGAHKEKAAQVAILKEVLGYHEVYSVDHKKAYMGDKKVTDLLEPITWELLEKMYYPRGTMVRVKTSGDVLPIYSVYVRVNDRNDTTIYLRDEKNPNRRSCTFEDIEKI